MPQDEQVSPGHQVRVESPGWEENLAHLVEMGSTESTVRRVPQVSFMYVTVRSLSVDSCE